MSDPHGGEHGGGHGASSESGHDGSGEHEAEEELDDESEGKKKTEEEEEEEEARLAEEEAAAKIKTKVKNPEEIRAENEARFAASNLAKPAKGHGDGDHGHGSHGEHHTPDGFFKRSWKKSGSGGALFGYGFLKAVDGIENKFKSLFKWFSNWGANEVKKNTPWMQNLWLIGDLLKPDEAPKKPEAHKPHKEVVDDTGKNLKKLLEADEKAMAAQVEAKRAEKEAGKKKEQEVMLNREKDLILYMTQLEEYQFKNGDAETKETLLHTVEADLPARKEKRKAREYESILIAHMTPSEQQLYNAPAVSPEEIAARETLKKTVEAELSIRAHIAEANQKAKGNKQKGKGTRS